MKTLMINTFENEGGAGRAAYRIHKGLLGIGVDTRLLVQYKTSADSLVIGPNGRLEKAFNKLRPYIDALPLLLYRPRLYPPWGLSWLPKSIDRHIINCNPDIIHLHMITFGFLPVSALARLSKPIIWTLHDSWAFTGGCHIPFSCNRYEGACGCCPQLNSKSEHDLSRWVWDRKGKNWQGVDMTFVAPSRWLAECARSSSLLRHARIEIIPNGIDVCRYKQENRFQARQILKLPLDKKLILYGALSYDRDKNKGFEYLKTAVDLLKVRGWKEKAEIIVFGAANQENTGELGLKIHSLGRIDDEQRLVSLFSAVDAFVYPSVQENLPNMVMEAMSCGTPCVTFNVGGIPDMIEHQLNGYLARPYDASDIADGIAWVLSDADRIRVLSNRARQKIEQEFNLESVAKRYKNLYDSLLDRQV